MQKTSKTQEFPSVTKQKQWQSREEVISPRSSNVEIIGANPISATMRAVILDLFGGSSKKVSVAFAKGRKPIIS